MALQPLDFTSQAVQPSASSAPLDFSAQAHPAPQGGALDFSSQAVAPSAPNGPSASRTIGNDRFGTPAYTPKSATLSQDGGMAATALDSATFGADRLLPNALSGPLKSSRDSLAATDPDDAAASKIVGSALSPVNLVAGPLAAAGDAYKVGRGLQAVGQIGLSGIEGAASGYGTSNNTGAARTSDAISGGEAGLGLGALGAAAGAGLKALMPKANPLASVDPTILQSRANVADMIRSAQANDGGVPATATQAAKSTVANLNAQIASAARALVKDPSINANQADGIQTLIPALKNQALGAHNMLGVDAAGNADGSAASALSQFHQLGIDPAKTTAITDGLRDLDTLSQNKFLKQTTGPAENIGRQIGRTVPAAALGLAGFEHGGLTEAALGGVGFIPGLSDAGAIAGAKMGRAVDGLRGNSLPPVLKQGDAAAAQLANIGVPRSPNSLKALQDANMARWQASPQNPSTEPLIGGFTQTQLDALRIKQAASSNAQMVKDQAASARANSAQRQADVKAAFGLTPAETMKASLVNKANATMATEGLPVVGDSVPIAQYVENTLQDRRNVIDPQGTEAQKAAPNRASKASVTPSDGVSPGAAGSPSTAVSPPISGDRREALGAHLSGLAIAAPGGVNLTPEQLSSGIDSAVSSGDLNAAQGEFYKNRLSAPLDNAGGKHDANLNTILGHAIAQHPDGIPPTSPLVNGRPSAFGDAVPNGGDNPVRNFYQHSSAAASQQAHTKNLIDMALAAKDPGLALIASKIGNEPSVAAKETMKQSFMATLTDPQAIARANSFLSGRFMTIGKK